MLVAVLTHTIGEGDINVDLRSRLTSDDSYFFV